MAYDTTRGINTKGVTPMKEAIVKYQKAVDSACDDALSYKGYRKTIQAAMAGTQTLNNLDAYLKTLKTAQGKLVSQLHKFVTQLDGLGTKYKEQDKKFTFQ